MKLTNIFGISAALATLAFSTSASAQQAVDLELGLILDGSGSVSSRDFGLQVDAYQNIFTDPNFYDDFINPLMNDNGLGQIAVSTWQFSSGVTQEIDWTLIEDQSSAEAFGNAFSNITQISGLTNTGGAINDATSSLLNNDFVGDRLVIDISTDGVPTVGPDPEQASIDSIAAGVDAINAIGVGLSSSGIDILQNQVVRGDDAFFLAADTFADFETGLETKLQREITNSGGGDPTPPTPPTPTPDTATTPEPASILGFLTLGAIGTLKRKKSS